MLEGCDLEAFSFELQQNGESEAVDSEEVGNQVRNEERSARFGFINEDGVPDAADPNASSRVSGLTEEDADLKSTLISAEVLDYYRKQEEKLRITVKRMCSEIISGALDREITMGWQL
ncbi:hypothetical protein KC19_VG285700 [Ceratodon purpureus]|uniref:Uncharacterized protein n=1 Tax=Ceratodon purpureus TaxID=3225 RepID=A0A8T0HV54_CERPU|nr:hypothetical protein KC19_VG285700 [Ceratodon purpureus]